jgi:predicted transcriptional regulator
MRITARLDPETDEQLNYLVAATGHTVSHVLRDSVAAQYRIVRSQQARSTGHRPRRWRRSASWPC